MNIICIVAVVFNVGGVNIMSEEQLEGKILNADVVNILVDFSQSTKNKNYVGDYSKKLVSRDKCIRE